MDGELYRAQAALTCLGHLACYFDESQDSLPDGFGFGLSVLLGYIKGDVTAAYNKLTTRKTTPAVSE